MTQWSDPYAELASLFLTDPDPAPPPAAPSDEPDDRSGGTVAATTEIVVVGSLPVRASLWVSAYADAMARRHGPAALVRLDDGPGLQVLGDRGARRLQRYPKLADAIAGIGRDIATWIIRPDVGIPLSNLVRSACDRITILTGDCETACVDAYRRAKTLVESADHAGVTLPPLGVAVVGAEREDAVALQRRLSETLSRELPLVMSLQRMDSAIRSADLVQAGSDDDRPSLEAVLRWIHDAAAPKPAAPRPAVTVPWDEVERADRAAPTVKLPPKPSVEIEPKDPGAAGEPDENGGPVALAAHVEDVTPIPVRCPGHERLEIALDGAGRLHVIAREADMRHLRVVEAWAKAHRELIGMACPGHWIDPAGVTVCHVFTERPASLADLQGCDLRLHVLAPVVVEGKRGWYAAPLSGNTSA